MVIRHKDMETIKIKKTDAVEIQINESEFNGRKFVNIRDYFLDKNTNEYKPTKKGVAMSPEIWEQLLLELKSQDLI